MENRNNYKLQINELDKFLDHIKAQSNTDIIFSAPFGTGKTFFLKEVFAVSPEVEAKYNVVHLFPVNYSISSNEDIFNLIKYDILIEIRKKIAGDIDSELISFDRLLTLQSYINNEFKPLSFVKELLLRCGLIKKSPFEVYELFKKEFDKYNSFHEEVNKDDDTLIVETLKELSKKNFLKEMEPISVLIAELGRKLKGNKQNLLIIDDLDRIDPEHIFRIINVFSAHRDYETREHKYGFDKVVLVCDIDNIKQIYKHKYGNGVDFNGYISKFISTEIFHYNVKNYLNQAIDKFFINSIFISSSADLLKENSVYYQYKFSDQKNHRSPVYQLFKFLVNFLIDNGVINIRDLTKSHTFRFEKGNIINYKGNSVLKIDYPFVVITEYLDSLLGGRKSFFNIIKEQHIKGNSLSFQNNPSQFLNPKNILITLLEYLLTLRIMPDDDIENTYEIIIKGEGQIANGFTNGKDSITLKYVSEFDHSTRTYKVVIDKSKLEWELLTFYNFNDFIQKVLGEFYRKNQDY